MVSRRRAKRSIQYLLSAVIANSVLCAPPAAGDWPEFRGPTRDGISTAGNVPVEWSATENIAWKQPIPGSGWSSPVIVDGKIYLTTATDSAETDDLSLRVLRINAADGQIEWDVEALRPDVEVAKRIHHKNSLASPTAVVAGNRLYAHFGHMGTTALDLDGNVVWRQTDLSYDPKHGNGGSPAVVGDLLVFSSGGDDTQFVIALDRATGELRWKTPRETKARMKFSFSTPLAIDVDGTQQIVSAGSGFIAAYRPVDGSELWRVDYGEGYSVVPRPVLAHNHVYVSSGYTRPSLFAIDPHNARGDVTATNVTWQHERSVPHTASLLVVGDEIYFVSDRGVASCLDAHNGREHWSKRLGGGFSASPVFADGRFYFVNEDGTTYVVRAGTDYELLATNELAERSLASPAVDEGAIFIRTESHLWRIGK